VTDRKEGGELMYVRCAYCREWLDVKPGRINEVTHTVCPKCMKKVMGRRLRRPGRGSRPR
jgi:ssDNA-binding Zn-finger/Zn-ribbon topoisomerase 1